LDGEATGRFAEFQGKSDGKLSLFKGGADRPWKIEETGNRSDGEKGRKEREMEVCQGGEQGSPPERRWHDERCSDDGWQKNGEDNKLEPQEDKANERGERKK